MRVALIALVAIGCTKAPTKDRDVDDKDPDETSAAERSPPATPKAAPSKTKRSMTSETTHDGVTLTFRLVRGADALTVEYAIDNQSDQRIYICDELLVLMQKTNKWRSFPAASLQNMEGKPDTARIVIGTPPTDAESLVVSPVTFKPLDAGQSTSETRSLKLPLESYNAMGMTEPLKKSVDKAVLVVQSFRGEPPSTRDLEGEKGPIKVPEGFTPKDLVSDPIPIPR